MLVTITKSHFGEWARQARPITVDDLTMYPFETRSDGPGIAVVSRFIGYIDGVENIIGRGWEKQNQFTGNLPIPTACAPKGLKSGPNMEARTIAVEANAGLEISPEGRIGPDHWYTPVVLQRAEWKLGQMIIAFNQRIIDQIERCFKHAAAQWTEDEEGLRDARAVLRDANEALKAAKERVRSALSVLHILARTKLIVAIQTEEPELFTLIPKDKLETIERESDFFL